MCVENNNNKINFCMKNEFELLSDVARVKFAFNSPTNLHSVKSISVKCCSIKSIHLYLLLFFFGFKSVHSNNAINTIDLRI